MVEHMSEKTIFNDQIDYENKTIAEPRPTKISDIDTDRQFINNIIDAASSSTLDTNRLNSFSNVSRSRNELYNLLDMMAEDPVIASALDIYASDVCEPNDLGQIIWAESDDEKALGMVNYLLRSMNVNKYAYEWVFSLIKYGDLYLRLYRESDYEDEPRQKKSQLKEDLVVKAYSKNDKYVNYLEMVKNPAIMFDLTKHGKTYGYLKTSNMFLNIRDDQTNTFTSFINNYKFNQDDVELYEATEFVHGSLNDNASRSSEEVTLTTSSDEGKIVDSTYEIRRGQSILSNIFKVWRELSMLENSVLLNRLTKASILRVINVELGDTEPSNAKAVVQRVKQLIEQKTAIQQNRSLAEYTNPGPMENIIYMPVHEGKGAITTDQIGGDVTVGDLDDLKYWKKKIYAGLSIPGQYLADTEDSTGFNGGSSLSIISSKYAKNVKRIQNAFVQIITDAINLQLLERGVVDYIGRFNLKMQAPTTQEEKDRRDNESNAINNISSVMSLLDTIETPSVKLEILKSLLSGTVNNAKVLSLMQDEIDRLTKKETEAIEENPVEDEAPSDDLNDFDFGGDTGSDALPPMDFDGLESNAPEEGGELLTEEEDLPSFSDLGISYTDVKN